MIGDEAPQPASRSKPGDYEDPDDWFVAVYVETVDRLEVRGIPRDEASVKAAEVMQGVIEQSAEAHANQLEVDGSEFISESAEHRKGFEDPPQPGLLGRVGQERAAHQRRRARQVRGREPPAAEVGVAGAQPGQVEQGSPQPGGRFGGRLAHASQ